MPLSAIIMLIFGVLVLYGGLAVCIVIALKSQKKGENKSEES
ncbi:MAG: hypothetical protein DRP84_07695 [Spirochaetes bacterium]|nr:MAG: hypothetical protein DRP84_07695 [Spirochaetota bacterium]